LIFYHPEDLQIKNNFWGQKGGGVANLHILNK